MSVKFVRFHFKQGLKNTIISKGNIVNMYLNATYAQNNTL